MSYPSLKFIKTLTILSSFILCGISTQAFSDNNKKVTQAEFKALKKKVRKLKQNVNQLEQDLNTVLEAQLPASVDIDCDAGDSISAQLTNHENSNTPLTLNISGTCIENIVVIRSNVTFNGVDSSSTIQALNPNISLFAVSRGIGNIEVNDLNFSGGLYGLIATKNSQLSINRSDISLATFGVVSVDSSSVEVSDSRIHDNTNSGVLVTINGVINLRNNTTVDLNPTGIVAQTGGTAYVTSTQSDGSVGVGSTIMANNTGIAAYSGSIIQLRDSSVSGNNNLGFYLVTNSVVHFLSTENGTGNTVSNQNIGLYALKNTSVTFGDTVNSFENNTTFALYCHPSTSYMVLGSPVGTLPGLFSGNGNNIINCSNN
ncbi:MAG: hypothetical protein K6L75_03685 [Cellvibrionaceae bacterium]